MSSGVGDTSLLKDGKFPGDKAPKRGIQTHPDGMFYKKFYILKQTLYFLLNFPVHHKVYEPKIFHS